MLLARSSVIASAFVSPTVCGSMRQPASLFERLTDRLRHCQCLLDARADGGSTQEIAREPNPRVLLQKFGDGGQTVAVAKIVLREGAGPNGDTGKGGFPGDGEDG